MARRGVWLSPVVFGIAAWIGFPSLVAQADVAGLLAGTDSGADRWRMVLTVSPAGSTHDATLAFPGVRRELGGDAGMALPDGRKVAFTTMAEKKEDGSDEDRVNRNEKRGRVVAVEPMQPPKAFSAGSILDRQTSLTPGAGPSGLLIRPVGDLGDLTAFAKVSKDEDTVEVADFFMRKDEVKADDALPPMLARIVTSDKADVLATAYGPAAPDFSRESPFDAILKADPDAGRFVPPIGPDDHAWAASVLPPDVFSAKQQQCLASGIYFEARGESVRGQAAVAQVILNRVRNPAYPATICDVVYQNEDWRNRCQFSFACDNIKDRIASPEHWAVAKDVAMAVTAGRIWLPEVGSATHYHAVYVHPDWARTMKKVGRIGLHVFYRTYGGGWS